MTGLLIELGYDEDAIPLITEAEWEMYAGSPCITSVTTYKKTDAQGNSTIVSEDEALAAAASAHIAPADTVTESSTYIKLVLLVIETTNEQGGHYFTASARWLTMPLIRGFNAIGIVAQDFASVPGTRTGYVYYCSTTYNELTGETSCKTRDDTLSYIDTSDITPVASGDFSGFGFTYPLRPDTVSYPYQEVITDYYVQIKFHGHVQYPTLESRFNVCATHDRSKIELSIVPDVSLDVSGGTPSVGIGFGVDYDKTHAMLQKHYTP